MHLTESEAKFIVETRQAANSRKKYDYVAVAAIAVLVIISFMEKIDTEALLLFCLIMVVWHTAGYPFTKKCASYDELLDFIEKKISESSDAIEAIHNTKTST